MEKEELFKITLWREKVSTDGVEWRGQIRHLDSGETLYFRDWSKMTSFANKFLPRRPRQAIQPEETTIGNPKPKSYARKKWLRQMESQASLSLVMASMFAIAVGYTLYFLITRQYYPRPI
jgi:uncharacterized protein with von Willebrand factor type A (vWA) domain